MITEQQLKNTLSSTFGFPSFRGKQLEIIKNITEGKDVFAIMPTGAGKSLCFQIPAIEMEGFAIVISPLIALMQDQVRSLQQFGVRALSINSSLSYPELCKNMDLIRQNMCDIVYVSPERLLQDSFIDIISKCKINLFAIDEAHCISQWGHDFRPEYTKLDKIFQHFPSTPKIALTATADEPTKKDIIEKLQLTNAANFVSSFDRPNISYEIAVKDNYKKQLTAFLEQHLDQSGIVYCMSKKKVDDLTIFLKNKGLNAISYHAGLSSSTRKNNQERFLLEEDAIMVATIAFGMGIDKPNVRFIAHVDLPKNIESYYQETGRAGRDGLKSNSMMLYSLQDIVLHRAMIEDSTSQQSQKNIEMSKLNSMLALCEAVTCRRQILLSYFGQEYYNPESKSSQCNNCDTCHNKPEIFNARTAAEKLISCIYRTNQMFGLNYIIDVLLGKDNDRIKSFRHNEISVFNIGIEHSRAEWQMIARQMLIKNLIAIDFEHKTLKLTKNVKSFLKNSEEIFMRKDIMPLKSRNNEKKENKEQILSMLNQEDKKLLDELKLLRRQIASRQNVPPYVIFHDTSLIEMSMRRPKNTSEMSIIQGVGEKKLHAYGTDFLNVIIEKEHL